MSGPEDEIVEVLRGRLWQSGANAPIEQVLGAGISAIVNVGGSEQSWLREWYGKIARLARPGAPRGPIYIRVPLIDASDMIDPVACDVAIAAGVGILRDPTRKLLVHCDAGAFRSVHVAAGIVASYRGWDGEESMRYVDRKRGRVDPRSTLGLAGWHEHVSTFGRLYRDG